MRNSLHLWKNIPKAYLLPYVAMIGVCVIVSERPFSPPTADPNLYYVPVIRAADNSLIPYLGSPCKMEGEQQSAEENGASTRELLLSSPVIGHALAGPMSETKASPSTLRLAAIKWLPISDILWLFLLQAHEVYQQWHSPTSSADRRQASVIKLLWSWQRLGKNWKVLIMLKSVCQGFI